MEPNLAAMQQKQNLMQKTKPHVLKWIYLHEEQNKETIGNKSKTSYAEHKAAQAGMNKPTWKTKQRNDASKAPTNTQHQK